MHMALRLTQHIHWRRNNISPVFHLVLGVAHFFCDLKEEMAKSDFLDCGCFISSCICFWAHPFGNVSFWFEYSQ